MKGILLSLALIVLMVGIAVAGCAKPAPTPAPTPAPAPPKTLDIGVASVLTGPAAALGIAIQNAILLTIDDQNNQGGITIAGQKYMLNPIIRDTKFSVIVGKSIAEELIFDKGVKVIAGLFVMDSIAAQTVTEPNKVILFPLVPVVPAMTGPKKPYTFFTGSLFLQMYDTPCAYLAKFYPEAKRVVSMVVDLPDLPSFMDSAKTICPRYGLEWLGYEKFPVNITDFMPVLSRVLAKNPDVIDVAQLGALGGGGCP